MWIYIAEEVESLKVSEEAAHRSLISNLADHHVVDREDQKAAVMTSLIRVEWQHFTRYWLSLGKFYLILHLTNDGSVFLFLQVSKLYRQFPRTPGQSQIIIADTTILRDFSPAKNPSKITERFQTVHKST